MTWPFVANLLVLVGVILQVAGLLWASLGLLAYWRREWPTHRLLPDWVHRLVGFFRRDERTPTPTVHADGPWTSIDVHIPDAPSTVDERLDALAERVVAGENALASLRQVVGRIDEGTAAALAEEKARTDARARAETRAGILGAPSFIIVGTALQILAPVLALQSL